MSVPSLCRCLLSGVAAASTLVAAAQSIDVPNGRPAAAAAASQPVQQVQVHGDGALLSGPHVKRTGAYSIKHEGDIVIMARCLEGGTVFVSRASLARVPGGTPAERQDAALRQSCRDVDLTK